MAISNQFISYVKFDEVKRILVAVNPQFQSYLHEDKNRKMIKQKAMGILKNDFIKLEIGKNICRLTVKEGTEEKNKEKIEKELTNALNMAMSFLSKMGKM
ncbi:hypothetical protein KHQ81_12035 [Mycoplasmatota bacterium]|nr:hypothetical protein KHQ81_12035 [Mycoplasmatota bacterium]